MLRFIRNAKFGWIIILMGVIGIVSGISKTEGKVNGKTLLCFDDGCVYVEGVSNIAIGFLCIGIGVYLILKK